MKKFITILTLFAFCNLSTVDAQIWSGQLRYFTGNATIYGPLTYQGVPSSIYQGGVVNGVANGWGTWYFANGEIFQGYFQGGWPNGAGIYFSYSGYLTGCWSGGNYAGYCQQQVQQFFRARRYGGVGDALADVSSDAPDDYSVNTRNYDTQHVSSSGKKMYGSGGF